MGRLKKEDTSKKFHYLMILVYVLALLMIFLIIRPYITYMILGVIIVIITYPINLWLRKKIKNRAWTSTIMILLVLLLVLIPSFFLATTLIRQTGNIITVASQLNIDQLSTELSELIKYQIDLKSLVFPALSRFASLTANSIPSLLGSITDFLVNIFVMFFLMYYLYKEGDNLLERFVKSIPIKRYRKKSFTDETKRIMKGVLFGQLLVSIIQGVLGGIGFWIFGVPNPVLWGFLMIIMSFVPFLGTPLIWGPAVILEFSAGNIGLAIGLLIYSGILVTNIDNFLKPKLIGKETGMHPVLILLGIFGGIAFFGFIGMIIGPVILAMCVLVIKLLNQEVLTN